MKNPTKAQQARRLKPFKFRNHGRESWFYVCHDICSFHQKRGMIQSDVFGPSVHLLIKSLKACGYIVLLLCALATTSYAAQVCTDAGEFQQFALSHKAKSAEIGNLSKQIALYIKNTGNLKEQNSLLRKEVELLQEAVGEQKKLNTSCEVLIDEHKKVLADALASLEEATKGSWIEKGAYLGTGFALGVVARTAWVKWVRR